MSRFRDALQGKRCLAPLWLTWLGEQMPPLATLWLQYLRRFALEHWYRFAKQRLYGTQPQFSSLAATEQWSSLMPLLSWQLWLARQECIDHPLPWQSPQDALAPGRVAQAFAGILAAIGTPAPAPKPRGKSPGRAKGHKPSPRPPIRRLKNEPRNVRNPSNPRIIQLQQQRNFKQDCIQFLKEARNNKLDNYQIA